VRIRIARVLGNSLPVRDQKKVEAVRYVLENGYLPNNISQIWILNQLRPGSETDELRSLLKETNQATYEIPFDKDRYAAAKTRKEKILAFIGINRARNLALEVSKPYDWLFLFDDTHFFTEPLWAKTVQDFEQQIACHAPLAKQFAVPMLRFRPPLPSNYMDLTPHEPALVFSCDSVMRFDENVEFGNGDKVELLHRLGGVEVETANGTQTVILEGNELCPRIGSVLHVSYSEVDQETHLKPREDARRAGLNTVICELD